MQFPYLYYVNYFYKRTGPSLKDGPVFITQAFFTTRLMILPGT